MSIIDIFLSNIVPSSPVIFSTEMGLSKLFFLKVIKLSVEKSLSESEIKLVLTDMVRFFWL